TDNAAGLAYHAVARNMSTGVERITLTGRVDRPPPAVQAALLRDIMGNPWRPVTLGLAAAPLPWHRHPAVLDLAGAAYQERQSNGVLDPVRLAVLADALEEADCADAAILDHCRGPGPHVCGCWALDLLLGKE